VKTFTGTHLKDAGYSYAGIESVYSGVAGRPLQMEIFVGVVYYQRLRHMVNDKAQTRSTGPLHRVTRQPVKGRKRHGGIRLGEMERDSMIAHGSSFVLHERLLECSDRHRVLMCENGDCVNLIRSHWGPQRFVSSSQGIDNASQACCQKHKATLLLPYVYRYRSWLVDDHAKCRSI